MANGVEPLVNGVGHFLAPICFLLDLGVFGGDVTVSSTLEVLTKTFLMVNEEGSSRMCELSKEFLANVPAKDTSVKQPCFKQ